MKGRLMMMSTIRMASKTFRRLLGLNMLQRLSDNNNRTVCYQLGRAG